MKFLFTISIFEGCKNSVVHLLVLAFLRLSWSGKLFPNFWFLIYIPFHRSVIVPRQVKRMHGIGVVMMLVVPSVLSVMNLFWFSKIFKGMLKTLKREWKKPGFSGGVDAPSFCKIYCLWIYGGRRKWSIFCVVFAATWIGCIDLCRFI